MQTQALFDSDTIPRVAELATAPLQSVLEQIEAELCSSALYEQATYTLRKMPVELGKQLQLILHAIGREAIRLSLRKLLQTEGSELKERELKEREPRDMARSPVTLTPQAIATCSEPIAIALESNGSHRQTEALAAESIAVRSPFSAHELAPDSMTLLTTNPFTDTALDGAIAPTAPEAADDLSPTPLPQALLSNQPKVSLWQRLAKLYATDQTAQAMVLAWEERLRAIGQDIRHQREQQNLSIAGLHQLTFIPEHILVALESGDVDHLPEDVYIRGFLRHVGTALGLDGAELANSLPSPLKDPDQAILPTWHLTQYTPGPVIAPIYLYAGYAALLAAGLGWVSHQATMKLNLMPSAAPSPAVEQPDAQNSFKGQGTQPQTQSSSQRSQSSRSLLASAAIARVSSPESFRPAIAVP